MKVKDCSRGMIDRTCYFSFSEEALQEKIVWDPNAQRNRRKVVFPENAEHEEGSSSSDDGEGDSEDDADSEDGDEDNLSSFLKEARAKAGKTATDGAPPIKKLKAGERSEEQLELPAFADSEDELEKDDDEDDGEAGKAGDSGHCSEEEDSDSDEIEEDDGEEEQQSSDEEEEEQGK